MPDVSNNVGRLATTEDRARLLGTLAEGALTRTARRGRADVDESTVERLLAALEREGLVHGADTPTVTPREEDHIREWASRRRTVETLEDVDEIRQWLPGEAQRFEPALIEGARVTLSSPAATEAPDERLSHLVRNAGSIYGLTSRLAERTLSALHESVVERDHGCDLIVTASVLEAITAEDASTARLVDLLQVPRASVSCVDDDPAYPYDVWLVDGQSVVGVRDETGVLQALVESGQGDTRRWVCATVESHRQQSRPLSDETIG